MYMALTDVQRTQLARSIRAQYKSAGDWRGDGKFVPPIVARARGLRLVVQKKPEALRNKMDKGLKASRNRLTALSQRVAKTRSALENAIDTLEMYQTRYRNNPTPALARIIAKQKERIAAIQGK
jgi:3-methyladenine DNA glycosylase/8-oxoguanine DNA glycosylase